MGRGGMRWNASLPGSWVQKAKISSGGNSRGALAKGRSGPLPIGVSGQPIWVSCVDEQAAAPRRRLSYYNCPVADVAHERFEGASRTKPSLKAAAITMQRMTSTYKCNGGITNFGAMAEK